MNLIVDEWECGHCREVIKYQENANKAEQKNARSSHSKGCLLSKKTVKNWPIPVWDQKFCCPYRYRGCLYSAKGIDALHKHCDGNVGMGNRCEVGPNPGDTCEDVYGPTTVDSLSSAELGQFVEERFAPTSLVCIKSLAWHLADHRNLLLG
jgi:hypothetical protein